jgi:uncharacterized protein
MWWHPHHRQTEAKVSQQFLYLIFPTRPTMLTEGLTPIESAVMAEHFAYLQRLLAEGSLILAGRTQNNDAETFGLAIICAESDDEAHEIMLHDPAVVGGVMTSKIYPYRVALISQVNDQRN